jgi:hypothetical protein
MKSNIKIKGTLSCAITLKKEDLEKVNIEGLNDYSLSYDGDDVTISGWRSNTFVNQGLEIALDCLGGLSGGTISHIGVTNDSTAVTATTVKLDPSGTNSKTLLAVQSLSRTGRILSGQGTFTNVNSPFAYRKIGFLTTSTDAGTGLIDVIGGGGAAPYDQAFNIDLTGAGTWSATLAIEIEFKTN